MDVQSSWRSVCIAMLKSSSMEELVEARGIAFKKLESEESALQTARKIIKAEVEKKAPESQSNSTNSVLDGFLMHNPEPSLQSSWNIGQHGNTKPDGTGRGWSEERRRKFEEKKASARNGKDPE